MGPPSNAHFDGAPENYHKNKALNKKWSSAQRNVVYFNLYGRAGQAGKAGQTGQLGKGDVSGEKKDYI